MNPQQLSREELYQRLEDEYDAELELGIMRGQLNNIASAIIRGDWVQEEEAANNWDNELEYEPVENGVLLDWYVLEQLDGVGGYELPASDQAPIIRYEEMDDLLADINEKIEYQRGYDQFGWFETLVQLRELINHVRE